MRQVGLSQDSVEQHHGTVMLNAVQACILTIRCSGISWLFGIRNGMGRDFCELYASNSPSFSAYRCYATGAGVPHNIGLAAQMFRQSNSLQDLEDLAKLKKQLDSVDFSGLLESP